MNSKLSLNIIDEVSQLSKVIVGQANNFTKPDISDLYDPTSKFHLNNNTYPKKKDLISELDSYKKALRENNIEPNVIYGMLNNKNNFHLNYCCEY